MPEYPKIVKSFPLTLGRITKDYTKMPSDTNGIFYHYTNHDGLEGILRDGGLRASYRMKMNDHGEFSYARKIVYEALDQIGECCQLPPKIVESIVTYTRINLDQFPQDSIEECGAYCACLTVSADHPGQWETYAETGKGFAIGFDMPKILKEQCLLAMRTEPNIGCAPVTYDESGQRELAKRLVIAGIYDLQRFAQQSSRQPDDLTALRNRITHEIVCYLLVLINFIKAPVFSHEREMRLFLNPNDGTMKAPKIEYYQSGDEAIPFIFFDFRDKATNRLPLVEIKVGPKASFPEGEAFIESLLDELGYGNNHDDRPRITQASL